MMSGVQGKPFLIMGVLNVTPDSFSDGGRFATPSAARVAALQMIQEGADIIDIGAESTRPGAQGVPLQEELDRLMPTLECLGQEIPGGQISVDSRKDEVFLQSAEFGVRWFNRVGALPAPEVLKAIARIDQAKVAMTHMHGTPDSMHIAPLNPEAAVAAVNRFFALVKEQADIAGLDPARLWFDPGIGFGKNLAANLALLGEIRKWTEARQVMIGVSRKSFIGRLFHIDSPIERDGPGKTIELMCALAGAGIVRTHDVKGLSALRQGMAGGI